jgi:hypothetical protein
MCCKVVDYSEINRLAVSFLFVDKILIIARSIVVFYQSKLNVFFFSTFLYHQLRDNLQSLELRAMTSSLLQHTSS